MKILIAIPCLLRGGTELQTLQLVSALCAGGHNVSVCSYFERIEAMTALFHDAGARVEPLDLDRSMSLARLLALLRRLFAAAGPDIVHVQYMAPGFIPVVAARLARVPRLLATVHQPATPYGLKARCLLRAAASMCDVFLCNSLATEESWFRSSRMYDPGMEGRPRGHYTLYNGVDVEAIACQAAKANRADTLGRLGFARSPIVGVVGRMRAEKGQETAIRSLPALLKTHPSAGLLVVGDGPDRGRLQDLCRSIGIERAVHFAGAVASEQVNSFYGVMDVLAVPSLHEGFCLAAAEAMAARVPVVASDIPALAEVLAGGEAGVLAPPGDSEGLASGLHRVLSDGDLRARITQAAFARVEKLFSKMVFDRNATAIHRALLQDAR
jgi:glycosyltransferase involved in cell wall biosynthesis